MAALRARGGLTAFDPNIRPTLWASADEMRTALMACPTAIVLPSFDDEAALFGDASPDATVARWRAAGADEVVVKNGGGPVTVWAKGLNGDEPLTIAVARMRPFDSTGAGDAFNGGYLAARLTGHAPDAAARAAHDVSLQVIARPGALMPMADVAPLPVSDGQR
jgi:2-dehydro-3-deoxygluconokinase